MASRKSIPALILPVAQSMAEASAMVSRIGLLQRERQRIEAAMNDRLASIKEEHEAEALPLAQEIDRLTHAVQGWAMAHRDELTKGGKVKSAALAAGEIGWRTSPPKVVVRGAEAVMDTLRRLGLSRFIRTKEELNKEAILNEPAAIAGVPGLKIEQQETFFVSPFETELQEPV